MKGIHLTKLEVEQHQKRHGFLSPQVVVEDKEVIPKPRMNRTEQEFSMMLEAQKRRGEILEWRFEGITLAWGCDPATGKPMRYTPDFYVVERKMNVRRIGIEETTETMMSAIKIIEVKGPHVYSRDLVRFKGCRSDWPMFRFELHQKTKEGWAKIL